MRRLSDIVLILLSVLILLLLGFRPLFRSIDRDQTIAGECRMFYSPDGPAAVKRCMAEMMSWKIRTYQ